MYGKQEKKIIFADTAKRHADLKIRLRHDGFTQSEFFKAVVTGYIENDEDFIKYVRKYKKRNNIQSRVKAEKVERMQDRAKQVMNNFGLKQEEKENIFDILEEEHPDL